MQPTIKDVLDFCQNKYARMRLFPATDEFVNRFNAHVAAIGRTVCHEQGVPFAVSNSLPDTTPLGTASAQLFTELQQMTHETPIDPAVVDDITESVM